MLLLYTLVKNTFSKMFQLNFQHLRKQCLQLKTICVTLDKKFQLVVRMRYFILRTHSKAALPKGNNPTETAKNLTLLYLKKLVQTVALIGEHNTHNEYFLWF